MNSFKLTDPQIGIVGRSGAGKSSVVASLFRLSDHDGRIYIDGVDTKTVALHKLRSSLYIIPQDPTLFSGTLRSNLDRKNEFTDEALWAALKAVTIPPVQIFGTFMVTNFMAVGQSKRVSISRSSWFGDYNYGRRIEHISWRTSADLFGSGHSVPEPHHCLG